MYVSFKLQQLLSEMDIALYNCKVCKAVDVLILDPCVFGLVHQNELIIRIYLVHAIKSGHNYVQVGINNFQVFFNKKQLNFLRQNGDA